jgi:hypothetical protein
VKGARRSSAGRAPRVAAEPWEVAGAVVEGLLEAIADAGDDELIEVFPLRRRRRHRARPAAHRGRDLRRRLRAMLADLATASDVLEQLDDERC